MKRWLICAVVVVGLVSLSALPRGNHASAQRRDPVTITRMFTGPDGLTHFQELNLPVGEPMMKVAGVQFNRAAGPEQTGTSGTFLFHNAPHRRYVVTLSGKAEIEASGGGKFVADAAHILLAEDVTGKGHRYTKRPLGDEDWIHVFVEIDQPAGAQRTAATPR